LICELVARLLFLAPPYPYREPPLEFVRDRKLSYFHKPEQVGWIDDGLATINSLGLRGDEPIQPKPAGVVRVLVMGDSIAFGWGVNDDETFCYLLQEALNRGTSQLTYEVINGAVSGYTTRQQSNLLQRLAPQLRPDMVLIAFYWNDLLMGGSRQAQGRTRREASTRFSENEPIPREQLHMTGDGRWWERLARRSRAAFVAGRGLKRLGNFGEWSASYTSLETDLLQGRQTDDVDERWERFDRQMKEISALAQELRFDTGVVVLPSRQQVSEDFPMAQIQSKVREIADNLSMFVIDPLPNFRARRDEVESLFIPYDRHHPTALGHRLIADAILAELVSDDRLHSRESLIRSVHP
jgi:lysophospholipase L1-like esterase